MYILQNQSTLLIVLCFALCTFAVIHTKDTLKEGDMAPDFTLYDENGKEYKLSSLRGKKIAIVFYPMDQTPGCTAELCSLRDGYHDLMAASIIILGINPASSKSHKKFKEAHQLPFPLLSDKSKKIAKAYGTKRWWPLPNRRYTFLIDENGRIVKILKNVQLNTHAQQILDTFKKV